MASILSHGTKKRSASSVVGTINYINEYIVKCEPGVTQKQVLDYFRALKIAPGYLGDSGYVCSSVDATSSVLDGQLWSVTAKYENVIYPTHSISEYGTPLDEPWTVRFGKTTLSQVVSKCFASWIDQIDSPPAPETTASLPIVNTIGDPFDPPLMQDIILPTIELNKNLSTSAFTSLLGALLDDTVNDSAITIAGRPVPKWGGKINIEGSTATYANPANGNPITYMQTRMVVTIHPQTWVRFVLNAGYYQLVNNERVRIKESEQSNRRTNTPSKLDEGGVVIEGGDPDQGVWLAFMTYAAKSWSSANLPSSLDILG